MSIAPALQFRQASALPYPIASSNRDRYKFLPMPIVPVTAILAGIRIALIGSTIAVAIATSTISSAGWLANYMGF